MIGFWRRVITVKGTWRDFPFNQICSLGQNFNLDQLVSKGKGKSGTNVLFILGKQI